MLIHLFSQQKIAKAESELFILNLEDPQFVGFVGGDVRRIADGSSSHFAGVLKLGLKKAVEFKRRSNGALLQCTIPHCPRNTHPVTYCFVGSNLYCPNCPVPRRDYNYSMYKPVPLYMCTGCRSRRNEDHQSCKQCSRRFV